MGMLLKRILVISAAILLSAASVWSSPPYADLKAGSTVQARTAPGYTWMPNYLGGPDQLYAVIRIGPLSAGTQYALSLIFEAGTDIGYGVSWCDGDPAGKDCASMVGTGTGTGTREMKGKRATTIFSVDPKSSSDTIFLLVRSNKPWDFSAELVPRPAGLTPSSQDAQGYYYVSDFDADRYSPFLLTRSPASKPAAKAATAYVEVAPGESKAALTAMAFPSMPNYFGGPDQLYAVFKLAPLAAGRRYAFTLTFDAGTDIGYGITWADGDPLGKDYASFLGTGTGTGTREMKGKKSVFLFTVDAASASRALYVILRSNKPFAVEGGLAEGAGGLTRDSQDAWGYYFVSDFDVDRYSPFKLTR